MDLLLKIGLEIWYVLAEMAPYLILGFFVAGILSVWMKPDMVQRHLGGGGFSAVLKATLLGIPLPLCSCGVIPVAASLKRQGAGRGATASFLLSTPQTGVDSILVTYSLLGPVLAILRPILAFISGLLGGVLVSVFSGEDKKASEPEIISGGCSDGCCSTAEKSNDPSIVQAIKYGFITLPGEISRALMVGLVIAGVISALVPDDFFARFTGDGFGTLVLMLLIGIPIYVCATGSVPIAAAMMLKGISPGAAVVFLLTGPATNSAAIATVWKIMGRRTAVIYLLAVIFTALASGVIIDAVFAYQYVPAPVISHNMTPGWFKQASGLVLMGILVLAELTGRGKSIVQSKPRTEEFGPVAEHYLNGEQILEVVGDRGYDAD